MVWSMSDGFFSPFLRLFTTLIKANAIFDHEMYGNRKGRRDGRGVVPEPMAFITINLRFVCVMEFM